MNFIPLHLYSGYSFLKSGILFPKLISSLKKNDFNVVGLSDLNVMYGYPSFNKIDSNDFFAISQIDFKELINKTIFSVAVDDSRPILKGCLLEIEEKTVVK